MPSHLLHLTLDELVFGEGISFPEVHKIIDSWQPYLQSNHRRYFHDQQTIEDIYVMFGNDKYAAMSAYLHIWLDYISDEVGQEHAIKKCIDMITRGEILLW